MKKIDGHFSLWLDMKGPQKRFTLMEGRRLDTSGIINFSNHSNKALIQLYENETTFVLNKGNPLDTSGYRIRLIY